MTAVKVIGLVLFLLLTYAVIGAVMCACAERWASRVWKWRHGSDEMFFWAFLYFGLFWPVALATAAPIIGVCYASAAVYYKLSAWLNKSDERREARLAKKLVGKPDVKVDCCGPYR